MNNTELIAAPSFYHCCKNNYHMLVYKFGGATTRTARGLERMRELVAIAYAEELRKLKRKRSSGGISPGIVVVISAIGHTTRRLRDIAEDAESGKSLFAGEALERIVERHVQLAGSLDLSEKLYIRTVNKFHAIAKEIASLVEGVTITRELSLRTLDAFLARGEQFATALIAASLEANDLPFEICDARNIIITNANFTAAIPNNQAIAEKSNEIIIPPLHEGKIVLTQGFIGGTPEGDTTTMGSESSDLTATLLGKALRAKEIVIWKSVPGIFTADPELIPKAKPIRHLSFEEADEIGRRGVRALFQNVAQPLMGENSEEHTALRVTAIATKPLRGTTISRTKGNPVRSPKPIALALEQNIATIYVRKSKRNKRRPGKQKERLIKQAGEIPAFALNRAFYYWASDTEITICFRRDERRPLLRALKDAGYEVVEERPLAALSLLVRTRDATQNLSEIRERLLRSLRRFPLRALLPVESSLVILVDEDTSIEALKHLHKEFFE
jgi:aspartate kinase